MHLLLVAFLALVGCATSRPAAHLTPSGHDSSHSAPLDRGGGCPAGIPPLLVQGRLVEVDAFEQLLFRAGLDDLHQLPPREADLTPEDAAELYAVLLSRPVTLLGFGQRLAASYLLREVMEGDEELSRAALLARVERFVGLAVLRPDGYLAWALSGHTQQYVGPVALTAGALRAGPFEVGRFYDGRGGTFFPVDERLRRVRRQPLAEVYNDGDVINRTLDGAEDVFRDTVLALGGLVLRPGDSLGALLHLPEGVADLVRHSSEYHERLRLMTSGERIRALSKLYVSVLATYGAAAGAPRTVGTVGRGLESLSVPALSVAADGTLLLQRAVPVGRAVTVLGGGPGAAVVLHMANTSVQGKGGRARSSASTRGPGQWTPVKESMSRRSARYQEQISGRPVSESYIVRGVRFDDYKKGVLQEAKGRGYANKFFDSLEPRRWFAKGADSLRDQALRQSKAANGVPIRWHVAESKAADAIRKLLREAHVKGIEVVHTPALP